MTVATITCDARIGFREDPDGWPNAPLFCQTARGLRTLVDRQGVTRHYCAVPSHRYAVTRMYGLLRESRTIAYDPSTDTYGPARRRRIADCSACARDDGPWHDAAAGCESGHRPHCSCDTCW